MAPIVKTATLPVWMEALAGVSVCEEVRPIKIFHPMLIGGEMGRHPIQNHTNALLMQVVHQIHEILGSPIAAGWGEKAGSLMAQRPVERMLSNWHQFYVGKPQPFNIVSQFRSKFPVSKEAISLLWHSHPGA